ncbi:hypothetical protein Tco_0528197 [Tanacetum coccineum]
MERVFILTLAGQHKGYSYVDLAESVRQIPDKGDLRDYWIGISSAGDFLGTTSSSTVITDLILRLCHRLIACSIAGRSQAPEKEEQGSYLGRKSRVLISGGQFVARLAEHFGLLSQELTIIAPALLGSERQPDATAGAHEAAEDAPAVDDDMPQAVAPLPRTQGERIARLEEEVHGMCELLQGQSEVLDHMAQDFSRFATWTVTSLARMMDRAGVAYTSYSETPGEY